MEILTFAESSGISEPDDSPFYRFKHNRGGSKVDEEVDDGGMEKKRT